MLGDIPVTIRSELVPFDSLLQQADYVTLHCPLTHVTRDLIDERAIDLMKPSAFLINAARGGIVDEAALFEALQSGKLGGAGLDVFETEPPAGSPLLTAPNTLLQRERDGARQDERQRLARDLHDSIVQQVFSVGMQAKSLSVLGGRGGPVPEASVSAPQRTPHCNFSTSSSIDEATALRRRGGRLSTKATAPATAW